MEYISIDIETTGLDHYSNQMIEFAAIVEDTHNPLSFKDSKKFHAIIRDANNEYCGSPFALQLNQRIFKILADRESIPKDDYDKLVAYDNKFNIVSNEDFVDDFYLWCSLNLINKPKTTQDKVKFIAAGKNFGKFDLRFLENDYNWKEKFEVHHRSLDPASMYWKPLEDKALPSLTTCLERAGIEDTVVNHTAMNDSWQVIQVLRGGNNYGTD